ncbi:MAG: prolyl oligopeptidase family serine peptidase, partial [Planctomycetota bacterium]|nr:prolyl oligopeptidase family serine peptidase [Planctomycetota bacterium]
MSETSLEYFTLTYKDEPGRVLRGRVERPTDAGERPLPWVLFLHGFMGFMNWGFNPEMSRRIARAGMAAVYFNHSGSGIGEDLMSFTELDAFARHTFTRQLEDTERVRLAACGGELGALDAERAGLVGHSRGGGLALIHGAEAGSYGAVVTWAAVPEMLSLTADTREEWRRRGYSTVTNGRTGQELRMDVVGLEDWENNRERFDVGAACGRLGASLLLIHGSEDEAVPFGALARLER